MALSTHMAAFFFKSKSGAYSSGWQDRRPETDRKFTWQLIYLIYSCVRITYNYFQKAFAHYKVLQRWMYNNHSFDALIIHIFQAGGHKGGLESWTQHA